MSSAPVRLTLLTLNVGLLRLRLLGRTVLEVPHSEARLARLCEVLAEEPADVLCLQEVFGRAHRDRLVAALRTSHPHVARHDDRRRGLTHGLLIASRHPLSGSAFVRFRAAHWWQRVAARQGWLEATVEVPGHGPLLVLDVHTTAGGRQGPETPSVERLRGRQIEQLTDRVASVAAVVCGDANAGPQASPANYRQLVADGWSDPLAGSDAVTWDPRNPLNRHGPFRGSPAQRIDHVLLSAGGRRDLRLVDAQVVHDRACVDVGGELVPVSDHSGVRAALVRKD